MSVTLAPSQRSVAAARHLVRKAFEAWGCDEGVWEATLLVSELATNAVLHAGSEFTVEVARSQEQVRISVSDMSTAAPVLRPLWPGSASGRGLHLVAEISCSWGFTAHMTGKVVWFEISLHQPFDVIVRREAAVGGGGSMS